MQKSGALQAIVHEIKFEEVLGVFTVAEGGAIICCSLISGTSNFTINDRTALLAAKIDGTFSTLTDDVRFFCLKYTYIICV